ncbi:hypothetical protein HPP92_008581 [Vanilla planifolia]|uniref:Uncharacterized protein n=1 Tax=Vanilla planifolia TaxID=51239 RepID=A0A835R691_VANPL|nr:hypothetical protein HPP92_008581 [Vanilla planifolia]
MAEPRKPTGTVHRQLSHRHLRYRVMVMPFSRCLDELVSGHIAVGAAILSAIVAQSSVEGITHNYFFFSSFFFYSSKLMPHDDQGRIVLAWFLSFLILHNVDETGK